METNKIRIEENRMRETFCRILESAGFNPEKALRCAEIFTTNSIDGVYSHGVNRFPRFVQNTRDGYILPDAEPVLLHRFGSLEQWDGNLGPGPLNATFATDRAMTVAEQTGIGVVSLANTNHWMRGGTYGWQAARRGFVFLGWTNTEANMPAWGATDRRLGNNPFVMAVPFENEAVVLDMAMSQFSYGKMEMYLNEGNELPVYGGYNQYGGLTRNPGEIMHSGRVLPVGFWKGAGFSLLLDILACILSGGKSAHEISRSGTEYAVSQVFVLINIRQLRNFPSIQHAIGQIINNLKQSMPSEGYGEVRYPGEHTVRTRNHNQEHGIPVDKAVWEKILHL